MRDIMLDGMQKALSPMKRAKLYAWQNQNAHMLLLCQAVAALDTTVRRAPFLRVRGKIFSPM